MDAASVEPIEWPKATIGGTEYRFRLSYASNSQLYAWGFTQQKVPVAAWAAAMAGHFDRAGKWRSARFTHWLDVADIVTTEEQELLAIAVDEAIKKASPESQIALQTDEPAKKEPAAVDGLAQN